MTYNTVHLNCTRLAYSWLRWSRELSMQSTHAFNQAFCSAVVYVVRHEHYSPFSPFNSSIALLMLRLNLFNRVGDCLVSIMRTLNMAATRSNNGHGLVSCGQAATRPPHIPDVVDKATAYIRLPWRRKNIETYSK